MRYHSAPTFKELAVWPTERLDCSVFSTGQHSAKVRLEMAFLKSTQLEGLESQKAHFLSPDWSKTRYRTSLPLNLLLYLPPSLMRQSKPPVSAHKENALKITFFLGVAGRFLSSRGDCRGRRGLWSGCSWGALCRSFAVSRS